MKKFKKSIAFTILLLLTACGKSVLSDIEITDPSLMKVKVEIEQEDDNENIVWVRIRDTKGRAIELKNGEVLINHKETKFSNFGETLLRGYKYRASRFEKGFDFIIRYNSHSQYNFAYGYREGFPGFGSYDIYDICPREDPDFYYNEGSATLKPAPFYNNKIEVTYSVLKKPEQMPNY